MNGPEDLELDLLAGVLNLRAEFHSRRLSQHETAQASTATSCGFATPVESTGVTLKSFIQSPLSEKPAFRAAAKNR